VAPLQHAPLHPVAPLAQQYPLEQLPEEQVLLLLQVPPLSVRQVPLTQLCPDWQELGQVPPQPLLPPPH
jgi:hypothetical protein